MKQSLRFTNRNRRFRCLKMEIKKAIRNRSAVISYSLVLGLALFHGIRAVALYEDLYDYWNSGNMPGNPMITSMSLFCRWLGADVTSFEGNLFYYLLPVFAVLPYGGSLVEEIKSGYTKNILHKVSRRTYFLSKYIAVFCTGALVIGVPLLLNFTILSFFLPAIPMDSIYPYGVIGEKSMWADLYFEQPWLYTFLYILLDMIFAGIIAGISTAVAFFTKHKPVVLLSPFFVLMVIDFADNLLSSGWELSPMKFLHVLPVANDRTEVGILLFAVVLFFLTFGIVWVKGGKSEAL